MKTHFTKSGWLTLVMIGFSFTLWAKPVWTLSVVVAIEKQTADYYQRAYAKSIEQIAKEQFETVNANFNKSGNFKGTYTFRIDSIYVFSGRVANEVFRPHPRYNYAVVVDGFFDGSVGGGWYGSSQSIYHAWKWDSFDGPFAQYATDGLTHEFAHARGAVDIYGMRVEGAKNPVNGQTFEPVNSIMNYPYGNVTWDEYTTNLLNSTGPDPIIGDAWVIKPFPASMRLTAVDALGQPLAGVLLEMYPVDWFSYSVSPTPILRYTTTPFGTYAFSANPFQPATSGYPWTMRYSNFLIKATFNSTVVYKWMPLCEVQNAYFRNGASSTYNADIIIPVSTPAASIKLTSVSASHFNLGDKVAVSFTTTGVFDPANQFTLFEIDKNNNSFEIGRAQGSGASTITGIITTTSSGINQYRLRVASTKPDVKSDDYPISINTLSVKQPTYNCETGAITFRVEGGDSTAITFSAPGVTRSLPTDFSGFVEQELRHDPKVIPITASQSGFSVTYNFNLKAYCEFTPLPPLLTKPSFSDMVLMVKQPISRTLYCPFSDPTPTNTPGSPVYNPVWDLHIDGLPATLYVSAKIVEGRAIPFFYLEGAPQQVGTFQITVRGSTAAFPDKPVTASFNIIVVDYNPYTQLTLVQPDYNCQTGAVTFLTTGGDGTPISYTAPGITRTSLTDNSGIVEQQLRNDPKPILIEASQNGQKSTYLFDFNTYCSNLPALRLLTPSYDCQSGAIHFNTTGGDRTPIEYMAAGITAWTTDPDQFVDRESRTANDVKPFVIMARQSGKVVTCSWNLKETCGRARTGTVEKSSAELTLTILGNPVQEQLTVLIRGLENKSVQLKLSDLQGNLVENRHIEMARAEEIQVFPIKRNQSGIFILQAITDTQTRSIRIVGH
ncbi:hypothetical protein [Spirosoma spitsbergense]|uniref:hypothetical protein n=1 Tax=Spirosoma spitsbergense TaxID=431554 RepID=UPI0003745AC3|nr:hypothetical protein [Spirosoma spitsbergense]